MFQNLGKKKWVAGFLGWCLLIVFAIGVTPRILLHDVISHHTDADFSPGSHKHPGYLKYEYNCGFSTLESTSPFIETTAFEPGCLAIYFKSDLGYLPRAFYFTKTFQPSLRGPPAFI